jgi:hypothetical protein
VADPRRRRGRRYRLAAVVSLALAATLAGARSFAAIGEWANDAPAMVLARLGIAGRPPSEKTIRRLLQRLDGDGLDTVLGAWMWLRNTDPLLTAPPHQTDTTRGALGQADIEAGQGLAHAPLQPGDELGRIQGLADRGVVHLAGGVEIAGQIIFGASGRRPHSRCCR